MLTAISLIGCGGNADSRYNPLAEKAEIVLKGKPYEAACTDMNSDGWDDLAVTVKYSGVYVFYNNGRDFSERKHFTGLLQHGISIKDGDFNGDRKRDLAVLVENAVQFFIGDGNGDFTVSEKTYAGPVMSTYIEAKDLDSNSTDDLVAVGAHDPAVFIYLNEGNLNFKVVTIDLSSFVTSSITGFSYISISDLDGDSFNDILVAEYQTGGVWVLWNEGEDSFAPELLYRADVPVRCAAPFLTDKHVSPDIIFTETTMDGNIVFLRNSGNRKFNVEKTINVSPLPAHVKIADMDSDGHRDIVITHLTSEEELRGRISILYGPLFDRQYSSPIGGISVYATLCDWDRDGFRDIFSSNFSSDTVTYIPSSLIHSPKN